MIRTILWLSLCNLLFACTEADSETAEPNTENPTPAACARTAPPTTDPGPLVHAEDNTFKLPSNASNNHRSPSSADNCASETDCGENKVDVCLLAQNSHSIAIVEVLEVLSTIESRWFCPRPMNSHNTKLKVRTLDLVAGHPVPRETEIYANGPYEVSEIFLLGLRRTSTEWVSLHTLRINLESPEHIFEDHSTVPGRVDLPTDLDALQAMAESVSLCQETCGNSWVDDDTFYEILHDTSDCDEAE